MSDSNDPKPMKRRASIRITDSGAALGKTSDFPAAIRNFYAAIGLALNNWQSVENAVFWVFCGLLQCKETSVASAAFHSVINFKTRLDMTHSAAQLVLDGETMKEWNALYNKTSRLAKSRNKIAHYTILIDIIDEDEPADNDDTDLDIYLRPGIYDARAAIQDKAGTLSKFRLKDVKAAADKFSDHAVAMQGFLQELPAPPTFQETDSL